MTPKSRWEESFPRQKFAVPVTLKEIKEVGVINGERLRALIKMKDDAIYDKKAEICKLREENDILLEVIRMMARGISNMSSPGYGPFMEGNK